MAHDFRNKAFQKVLRGYAPDEVDDYIAYLNEEYRKMERRAADGERKLALAQKKLDECMKNAGAVDSVGPAAREAAAKLLREAETKCSEILAVTEQQAGESAERLIREAEEKADETVQAAVCEAEAILAEARAEAEVHKNDAKRVYDTARSLFGEIGSFREKLFDLYNSHLDAVEGITDAAQVFMDGIDAQYPEGAAGAEPAEETDVLSETEAEHELDEFLADEADVEPAEEDILPEEEPLTEEFTANEYADDADYAEEDEYADVDEVGEGEEAVDEEPVIGEEEASNLAFIDRLFAELRPSRIQEEANGGEDLYIDLDEELPETEEDDIPAEPDEPIITIDWKNRSAVGRTGAEEDDEPVTVEESDDFRAADGFDEIDEVPYDEIYDEKTEENYDEYGNEYVEDYEEERASDDGFDEEEAEDEEDDEYSGMDAIFNEDKTRREMSLTDEFNIIFSDSKSNDNVQEISRQPTVAPEAPKKPKKHKNF